MGRLEVNEPKKRQDRNQVPNLVKGNASNSGNEVVGKG